MIVDGFSLDHSRARQRVERFRYFAGDVALRLLFCRFFGVTCRCDGVGLVIGVDTEALVLLLDGTQSFAVENLALVPRALSFVELTKLHGLLCEDGDLAQMLGGLQDQRVFSNWFL